MKAIKSKRTLAMPMRFKVTTKISHSTTLYMPGKRFFLGCLLLSIISLNTLAQSDNFTRLETYRIHNIWKVTNLLIQSNGITTTEDASSESNVKIYVNDKKQIRITNQAETSYLGVKSNGSGKPVLVSHNTGSNGSITNWVIVKGTSTLKLYHPQTKRYLSCNQSGHPILVSAPDDAARRWRILKVQDNDDISSGRKCITYKDHNGKTAYVGTSEGGGVYKVRGSSSGKGWSFERYGDTYFIKSQFGPKHYLARPDNAKPGDALILSPDRNSPNVHWIVSGDKIFAADKPLYLSMNDEGSPCLANEGMSVEIKVPDQNKTPWFNKNYAVDLSTLSQPETTSSPLIKVDGRNVKVVEYAGGYFINTGGTNWKECSNANGSFNFKEQNRDQWSVYLFDSSRNIHIQLDLWKKTIFIGTGQNRSKLYSVSASHATMAKQPCR